MHETLNSQKIFFYKVILLCSFFFAGVEMKAQQSKAYVDSVFKRNADTTRHFYEQERPYYVARFIDGIPQTIHVIRQFDKEIAIVEITSDEELELIKAKARVSAANDHWKLSPLAELITDKEKELTFILSGQSTDELLTQLRSLTTPIKILSVNNASHSILINTNARRITEELLGLKDLIFVDVRLDPHPEINIIGYNRSFHGINAVDYLLTGANGKNIVAGVKEQKMDENDIDLYKRVIPSSIAATNITNHATVVSSIIGGAGNSFYSGRGIAWGCKFFSSSFANLFADDAVVLNTNKVTVQNHSYGTGIQQFYGAEAVSYDAHTWSNKNFVHIFSAGNTGTSSASTGQYANLPGFANITGNFKMAKNIITVGAIDNKGNIPAESSAGPLYDGRIAPQIIALGPNGTSDAAAVVSGTVAVMQQVYADSNNLNMPPASLIKAVLYNRANDIYRVGIDYKTGYGLIDSYEAIRSLMKKEYENGSLTIGQQWQKTISVPAGAAQLKITLAWTDSAAAVNNSKALINDLDLEVLDVANGILYRPWVLSTVANPDSLGKEATRKRDSLNTAEQVSVSLPSAGNYEISVNATSIFVSSLPFTISWHIDTLNTFAFTSPLHSSDVIREENPILDIRWKTFVADTNTTGNLYISYNRGINWQLITSSYKIYRDYFQWPIKDTNSTALLKMETPFGVYLSKEFIISKLTRPVVNFLCADSVGISWNKHIYATAYNVYTLIDSPYLKKILTVADTFIILKRSQYPSLVYAVEPILSNGIPAARSQAIDITSQGVKCFYKTFYYSLQDKNVLDLILELSDLSLVDSVIFEQVSITGQFLKTLGSSKVNAGSYIYHQLATDVPTGTSYWRVKIKLKNGNIVYTEIISAFTSGKRYIVFYPNPNDRSNPLTWVLQQGVPPDSHLQLYDITGRMLKNYSELPNSISLSRFAPGIIIYKLYSSDNQLLETGKLMIR